MKRGHHGKPKTDEEKDEDIHGDDNDKPQCSGTCFYYSRELKRSCNYCVKYKRRCDGIRPLCGQCSRFQGSKDACDYTERKKPGRKPFCPVHSKPKEQKNSGELDSEEKENTSGFDHGLYQGAGLPQFGGFQTIQGVGPLAMYANSYPNQGRRAVSDANNRPLFDNQVCTLIGTTARNAFDTSAARNAMIPVHHQQQMAIFPGSNINNNTPPIMQIGNSVVPQQPTILTPVVQSTVIPLQQVSSFSVPGANPSPQLQYYGGGTTQPQYPNHHPSGLLGLQASILTPPAFGVNQLNQHASTTSSLTNNALLVEAQRQQQQQQLLQLSLHQNQYHQQQHQQLLHHHQRQFLSLQQQPNVRIIEGGEQRRFGSSSSPAATAGGGNNNNTAILSAMLSRAQQNAAVARRYQQQQQYTAGGVVETVAETAFVAENNKQQGSNTQDATATSFSGHQQREDDLLEEQLQNFLLQQMIEVQQPITAVPVSDEDATNTTNG